ncbi:site-specific tyrosine recombinase XerD [Pedobacter flavus]|uniref:Tyrosine recombinase XerC n=1 Tax=Pedobacter flavus TaxID=3113906 RepID=A0ABU7H3Q4_9SPHI|nr:site-specific tyrosine recombinase XerD [Pedobacter sp. VNH31]MEE1885608.1 site-specific tyrosine recombinase XerD [Pedobacter sp. VNH31]
MIFQLPSYKVYLSLERGLSKHTVKAYINDISKLFSYLSNSENTEISYDNITDKHLIQFLAAINELGIEASSQARMVSGIKSYFQFLVLSNYLEEDPTILLESPRLKRKLPETLSLHEIDKIMEIIDLSTPEGIRNKAMIELLYGCGLRVTELCELKISNVYTDVEFIKIIGKGNKERLVPIGTSALKHLTIYLNERRKIVAANGFSDFVFLNRFKKSLSRISVFNFVKELALKAGIQKNISPHTFRHSFATHLIEGGADLYAVQEMLGHSSITTTEIYTHLDRDYLKSVVLQYHPRS